MRTTLDLPEELVNEAKRLLGYKSKTDTIVFALTDLIRRRKIADLIALMKSGELQFDIDLDKERGRPRRVQK